MEKPTNVKVSWVVELSSPHSWAGPGTWNVGGLQSPPTWTEFPHTCRHTLMWMWCTHNPHVCIFMYMHKCMWMHTTHAHVYTNATCNHHHPPPPMLKAWESPNSPQHNFRLWHKFICELIALSSKYPLKSIPKVIIKVSLTSQFRGCYLCAPRVRAEYGTKSSLTRRVPGKDVGGL